MAARRTRIKAIANITQRKKPAFSSTTDSQESVAEEIKLETLESSNSISLDDKLKPDQIDCDSQPESSVEIISRARKSVSDPHVSDTEYPGPPPSPSKFNRNRIKPVPRLGLRKPSASESEDESRRYGRIRNNSVCSVASVYQEPQTPTSQHPDQKDAPAASPKKIFRNEQSRKLAEARREFHKRFGSTVPDKQRLRMIDLIFYNPNTNPMSPKAEKNTTQSETKSDEQVGEDSVDDPTEPESTRDKENDTDTNLPVPQIKIGPSGEIILDEQSVVMENTQVAKQKEQIRNSEIVDGDSMATYGLYKRATRALAWTQKETLRFYKALNLIGTDFTLMANLFPTRNRRELKIKFKKEEKINMQLIEKAIKEPCCYNFADLKREMEIELAEEAFLQKVKDDELKKNSTQDQAEKRSRKRKNKGLNSENNESNPVKRKRSIASQKTIHSPDEEGRPYERSSASIDSPASKDDDADISDLTQSDTDEEEFIPFLKPTRFGRMPKSTLKFNDAVETPSKPSFPRKRIYKTKTTNDKTTGPGSASSLPVAVLRNRRLSSTSNSESNSEKLVPGAVIIMGEEGANNDQQYKAFMVTPEKKLAPVEMDSDAIATLVAEKASVELPLTPSLPEQNVTIPASPAELTTDHMKTPGKENSSVNLPPIAHSKQENESSINKDDTSIKESDASVKENDASVKENDASVKKNDASVEEEEAITSDNPVEESSSNMCVLIIGSKDTIIINSDDT